MLATLFVAIPTASAAASSYTAVTKIKKFDASGLTSTNYEVNATNPCIVQIKVDPGVADTPSSANVEVLDSKGKQLDILSFVYKSSTNLSHLKINGRALSGGDPITFGPGTKKFKIEFKAAANDEVTLNFYVTFDGRNAADGDVKLNFFGTSGQLDAGSVVFAQAVGGQATLAVVGDPATVGEDSDGTVTIRVTPSVAGAFAAGDYIKIKLPAGFEWSKHTDATVYNPDRANVTVGVDGRLATITATDAQNTIFDVVLDVSVADTATAKKGDVVATVEGSGITVSPSELTVAKYADYAVNITVASVKELLAGKVQDQKTDKITLKEKVAGSILPGRNLTIELPDWVKIVNNHDYDFKSPSRGYPKLNADKNKITLRYDNASTAGSEREIYFKLELSIEANKSGDIKAVISGAGVPEQTVVIAKAVAPVSVSAGEGTVKIGVKDQAVGDVVITEGKAGALAQDKILQVDLPDGVTFAATPSVAVTSGDLEIKDTSVKLVNDNNTLQMTIKSESLKASTIKVSGIKLNVDRTVPEGTIVAKVLGEAVVDNYIDLYRKDDTKYDLSFDTSSVVKFPIATVGTPAPGVTKGSAVFTLGSASYTLNGQTVSMPVAPYVKNGRTYLPLRFCGNAIGISDANIWWDSATKTATLKKDNTVVQVKLGSQALYVNGVQVTTMDVAPEVKDGYTMLPIRPVLEALGAKVTFDAATQAVSIEYKE